LCAAGGTVAQLVFQFPLVDLSPPPHSSQSSQPAPQIYFQPALSIPTIHYTQTNQWREKNAMMEKTRSV
jgi:hypothetical protein